jgi:phosphohistidine phosphatase SixA
MIQLYLIRHGIAVDREDPNCPPDTERPLTPKGL